MRHDLHHANQSPPKSQDAVRDRIRANYYCLRTEQSFAEWIRRYIRLHDKRHLREMGVADLHPRAESRGERRGQPSGSSIRGTAAGNLRRASAARRRR